MFQHRIEDRQEFAHAGGEGDLLGFAHSLQALIEGPDHRIEASRHDGIHIQDGAHLRSSTPDCASPPQWGSTPFPRTVELRAVPSVAAAPVFAAAGDCDTVRCRRRYPLLLPLWSGSVADSPALA